MSSTYNYKIGLEVHVQLKTKYKLFSKAFSDDMAPMNSKVAAFDVAVPGTFPIINMSAVKKAILVAKMLNCEVSNTLTFDRKHYYYVDLPSGYQITQYYNPIGKEGFYYTSHGKRIGIKQAHIECDAGKTSNYGSKMSCDYNRCGVPLVEVVTHPDFLSYEEVEDFIRMLVSDLRFNSLSNALFEMGNIRIDVNISRVLDVSSTTIRYEIKNLNSLKAVKKSIAIASIKLIDPVESCDSTFAYNVARNELVLLRPKEKPSEYMYMYETSLYSICLSKLIEEVRDVVIISSVNEKKMISTFLPNVQDKFVMNIVTNKVLYRMFILILNNFDRDKCIPLSAFASEVINEVGVSLLSAEDLDSLMLDAFSLLAQGMILKVNLKKLVCDFLNEEKYSAGSLVESCKKTSVLITSSTDLGGDLLSKIRLVIDNSDDTLLCRLRSDKKAMSFALGLVIKAIPELSPKDIIKAINQLLSQT